MEDPRTPADRVPYARPPADHAARREEARRCLLSVVGPALRELRTAFRAHGRDVRADLPGAAEPTEATLVVAHAGRTEFACTIRVALGPERALVLKRRTVPDPAAPDGTRVEESPLLDGPEERSDARTVTRAEVVASVTADYQELRRARDRA